MTRTSEEKEAPIAAIERIFTMASHLDRFGMGLLRLGLVVVLVWIGGLKFAKYEADGIVPLVSNSPLMSFFYSHPAPEYRQYMNREGKRIPLTGNGTRPTTRIRSPMGWGS